MCVCVWVYVWGRHPFLSLTLLYFIFPSALTLSLLFAQFLSVCFSPFSVRCSFFQVISKCVLVSAEIQLVSIRPFKSILLFFRSIFFYFVIVAPQGFSYVLPVSFKLLTDFFFPFARPSASLYPDLSLSRQVNFNSYHPSS